MIALKGERTGLLFDYWFLFFQHWYSLVSTIDIPFFPPLIFPCFPHCFFLNPALAHSFCIF